MTTIAWDGTTLAADSRVVEGYVLVSDNYNKLRSFKYKNKKYLAGIAGTMAQGEKFFAWIEQNGFDLNDPPRLEEMDAVIVSKEGVWCYEGSSQGYISLKDEKVSIGSGSYIALAGMRAGLSAEESILLASEVDLGTNNNIRTLTFASSPRAKAKSSSTSRKDRPS